MKNVKYDTKGHMISYDTDDGNTITDYKALGKAMGINNERDSRSYSKDYESYAKDQSTSSNMGPFFLDGANPELDKKRNREDNASLMLLGITLMLFLFAVVCVISWLLFHWVAALIITILLFGIPLVLILMHMV